MVSGDSYAKSVLYVVVNSSARSALYSHVGTLQGNAVNRFDNAKFCHPWPCGFVKGGVNGDPGRNSVPPAELAGLYLIFLLL